MTARTIQRIALFWLICLHRPSTLTLAFSVSVSSPPPSLACPRASPATGLDNRFYEWKHGQRIRYQRTELKPGAEPVLLIHGLFVNSDHWRHTLKFLDEAGYNAYAIDLFGCGYSDKPPAASEVAQKCNGENGRFDDNHPSILSNIPLGSPKGGPQNRVVDIDLRHPLSSPYNFYTWAEQIVDFCQDVILQDDKQHKQVSLVCNSIGTISSFQACIDQPDLFKGVFVVCPNFRELHSAEVPYAQVTMAVVRAIQKLLRERGQVVFDALAKPDIVREILKEPYAIDEAVDDELVKVLLDPLLTEGSSQVVFDTLSYSAGPLPEQQLRQFPEGKPVWVVYGDQDPWTPGPRVEALTNYAAVEKVTRLRNVGHCPHDEAPEQVHQLLLEFMERLRRKE